MTAKVSVKERGVPALQRHCWPPVPAFEAMNEDFKRFIGLGYEEQNTYLNGLRDDALYVQTLNEFLGVVSAYLFSYHDSPLHLSTDDDFEIALQRGKILLEREVIDHWLPVEVPEMAHGDAVRTLEALVEDNPGVTHPLFEFLEKDASREAFKIFLRNEVCRNEVVDDEVAVMSTGLQGPMKIAVSANFWDEVGRGKLEGFHTYWLRRLIEGLDDWDSLVRYRRDDKPWYTMITTNVFNVLLTRPGLKWRRYGWFALGRARHHGGGVTRAGWAAGGRPPIEAGGAHVWPGG